MPGTNYSVLLAVRAGLVVSPGVTAVTGLLVPDNNPPSFTTTLLTGAASDPALGTFTLKMTIGIDEPGGVYYAVYGNPRCITGGLQGGRKGDCRQQGCRAQQEDASGLQCVANTDT